MGTLGNNALTLAEWSKRVDPSGDVAAVVETLSQTNEILEDAAWVEGNLPTGHRTTVRTDLPTVSWRKLNYGIKPSKSRTKQVDDTCGMLESYAEMDKALSELNGHTSTFRVSEERAFLEAMNQEFADTFVYGDTALEPEKYLGLSPRFSSLEHENVVNFGGTGNNCTSIWIVCWSDQTVHFTFPKGSTGGLTHKDLGEVTLEDANGGKYQGLRTHFKWTPGLVVRDWRYVMRIASIDTTNFGTESLRHALIQALNKIPNTNMGKTVIYCNQTIKTQLDIEASDKNNVMLKTENWEGKPVTTFWGCPIRRVDSILNTESAITA
ncbi:major capsid protein [Desulfovibrio gilichinskyi]|jgi:hypothetical protein|uniref:Uncharacterized protein n=1 Tax=Desulfovibrio gilichinskyi TaxID=1519643 RepID=A0A1X7C1U9_9BACT|nr:hypothetical protein [Desulfovibrio gilichinskyi]SME88447.1 hypothetical protein SAMN06295933_0162 [Desulfovibrio gilichinskyi]